MSQSATTSKRDLYSEVTASIVKSLETATVGGGVPWTNVSDDAMNPRNVVSHKPYRGVNVLLLWAASLDKGYRSGLWATFNQWKSKGASVRKGEKATTVVLWKPFDRKATQADVTAGRADKVGEKIKGLLLRHFNVFAAEQVDGFAIPESTPLPEVDRNEAADAFFAAVGADVRFGGNVAAYAPAGDYILHPEIGQFADADHFYATLAHEHGHWTGAKSRLDRDLTGRFGTESYAAEELVAELTAAFVGAHLGFAPSIRDDHARYIKSWISLLKADDRAIFTASSKAQQATDYLRSFSESSDVEDSEDEEVAA
jgi:antirestriction protein ArdC